jgi:hypothetical protein
MAANIGQKVMSELMGSFIGRNLVRSLAIVPSIKNGIERTKTNKKNFSGDLFVGDNLLFLLPK